VQITLEGSAECVVLDMLDDGTGTTVTSNGRQPAATGYGLIGLRERVALLDGHLSFERASDLAG
jgi:signal transduction histidine kinase